MKKQEEGFWDRHQMWKFGWDIIVGLIIMGTILTLVNKDKDWIPESDDGKTFVSLNVPHCAITYDQQCYIENSELELFLKNEDWACRNNFGSRTLIMRANS